MANQVTSVDIHRKGTNVDTGHFKTAGIFPFALSSFKPQPTYSPVLTAFTCHTMFGDDSGTVNVAAEPTLSYSLTQHAHH